MLGVKMVCANLEGANLKGANFEVMNFHCAYLCILNIARIANAVQVSICLLVYTSVY